MQARMKNPVLILPEAMQALFSVNSAIEKVGLSKKIVKMIHLRVSQINGCSLCVDMHARELVAMGETNERIFAVAAWRDAPFYTDAERAALALAEAATRLSDRTDPVPDALWNEAVTYYDERELSALLLTIALINVWNRLNVPTRQIAGEWAKSAEARAWMEKQAVAQ